MIDLLAREFSHYMRLHFKAIQWQDIWKRIWRSDSSVPPTLPWITAINRLTFKIQLIVLNASNRNDVARYIKLFTKVAHHLCLQHGDRYPDLGTADTIIQALNTGPLSRLQDNLSEKTNTLLTSLSTLFSGEKNSKWLRCFIKASPCAIPVLSLFDKDLTSLREGVKTFDNMYDSFGTLFKSFHRRQTANKMTPCLMETNLSYCLSVQPEFNDDLVNDLSYRHKPMKTAIYTTKGRSPSF